MTEKEPTLDEWKLLYELMSDLKSIAPWQWMEEVDIFGVENPETGEIGFVSVMGAIGEHYAIAVYRGEEGLRKFWDFREKAVDESAFQRLMEMPQLQASFEDQDYLFEKDRNIIKKLGFTFRGKRAWPMFKSFSPGLEPWLISSAEARFLIYALQQTIDVSIRARENPSILEYDDDKTLLLCKPIQTGNIIQWQDSTWKEPPIEPETFDVSMDMFTIEKFNSLSSKKATLEIDVFMSPQAVCEKNSRPYFPYVLLIVETNNGMIIGHEILPPLPNLTSMWENVPYHIINLLTRSSLRPTNIHVDSELLFQLFSGLINDLGVSIEIVERLPFAQEARRAFLNFLKE